MIYVTHDQTEAMTMGDRIAVFNRGIVRQVGPPMALYHDPVKHLCRRVSRFAQNEPVADDMAAQARAHASESGGSTIAWNGVGNSPAESSRDDLLLGIRPEHFEVFASGDDAGSIAATVDVAERLGIGVLLYLKVPGIEQTLAVKVHEEGRQWQRGAARSLAPARKNGAVVQQGRAKGVLVESSGS